MLQLRIRQLRHVLRPHVQSALPTQTGGGADEPKVLLSGYNTERATKVHPPGAMLPRFVHDLACWDGHLVFRPTDSIERHAQSL